MIGDQVVKVTISIIVLVIIANMMVTVRQRRTDNKVEKNRYKACKNRKRIWKLRRKEASKRKV